MSGDTPLHLLSVWNPSYADDAMDRRLEVLLAWAERDATLRGESTEIARVSAGRRLREEQERIMADGAGVRGSYCFEHREPRLIRECSYGRT